MNRSHRQLLKTVLKHKWYVFTAGRRLRVPFWRLVKHDLSKFSRAEFRAYAEWFYGTKGNHDSFQRAWLHHIHANDHHWEAWIVPEGDERLRVFHTADGPVMIPLDQPLDNVLHTAAELIPIIVPAVTILPMPLVCVREMVADWFAAGKAYNGAWPDPANYTWYRKARDRLELHPDTVMRIGLVLAEAASYPWKDNA
jgi:hypothetical protein